MRAFAIAMLSILVAITSSKGASETIKFTPDQECDTIAGGETCHGTLNGLTYLYRFNKEGEGSGLVAKEAGVEWEKMSLFKPAVFSVRCKKDPLDDGKICILLSMHPSTELPARTSRLGSNKAVYGVTYTGDRKKSLICVGQKHYPGEEIRIRFDEQKLITQTVKDDNACFAPPVAEQLLGAQKVVSDYVEWPTKARIVGKGDTIGLQESIALADFLLGGL